jgi:hypothetical protein
MRAQVRDARALTRAIISAGLVAAATSSALGAQGGAASGAPVTPRVSATSVAHHSPYGIQMFFTCVA